MPSIQNLVLTDRASTPVNHTFTPSDVKGGVGTVVESNGTRVGDRTFTVSGRASPVSNRWNAKLKLVSPVIGSQIANGITTTVVLRTSFATVDFSFPADSTLQERKDLVGMLQSALDPTKVLVNDTVIGQQGVYGS